MELFRLLGTIAINNSLANAEIDETTAKAENAGGKMSNAFGKIGQAAVKMAAAIGTAAVTAGAAITKMAVESYADYEQLVGGVETLFKDSADKVKAYAQEAYKTAGLSANAYMETVTSFSASLLQSLGNDTEKAVEYANMAIIDMSDNANKMGTDMAMIQNAYQGFAKQNYTMLDNLKLGYGGTKEEMERLLKDAEKLSGMKFDISSYSDVVEAIHVIQTEMGITGTTAKEAATTISGSMASMKASWQNLLTGFADGNQDLDVLLKQFTDSVVTAGENLIPRIKQTVTTLLKLVVETGREMFAKLSEGIEANLPVMVEKGLETLTKFSETILSNAPKLISAGLTLLRNLVKGIMDALPILIEKVPTIISNFANVINENAPKIIMAGFGIVLDIITGLLKAIPTLVANIPKIIRAIVDAWTAFNWINIGKNAVKKIGDGFGKMKEWIKTKAKGITESIKKIFTFDVKLPKIKLPHFAVSPKGWKIGDLLKGSIPKLGIDWYAKGGVFDQPTIIPTMSGLKGVGEAGAEAVAPINVLQSYVSDAVKSENAGLTDRLDQLIAILQMQLPELAQRTVVLDSGELVGALTPAFDYKLGVIMAGKERGR